MQNVPRRHFIKLLAGGVGAVSVPMTAVAAPPYRVGLGRSSDAYDATIAAVSASGEWPAARFAGQTVIIKPNLVFGAPTEGGSTTSPQAVRALVDLALDTGAARVRIVESGRHGATFSQCGYDFFRTYDSRVALVDLNFEQVVATTVTSGWTYRYLYLPRMLFEPGALLISAGKLKTHVETAATLSVKNLFGLPPIRPYFDPVEAEFRSRYHLHDRGVHQAIADLLAARPIDYAIVEGIWGMEGDSPDKGTPVAADLVAAGLDAVAVDRVCLNIMSTPQDRPQHLAYANLRGFGPTSMAQIELAGATYTPRGFVQPAIPPLVWPAKPTPLTFSPGAGNQVSFTWKLVSASETRCQILKTVDLAPSITLVRTIRDWQQRSAGYDTLGWDGRDDTGKIVTAGAYAVRVQARSSIDGIVNGATNWVGVLE